MSDPSPTPSLLARSRALLIALALAIHGLAAAPLPHAVTRQDLRDPVAREELARWAARLGTSPEDLSERLVAATGQIARARRALLAPVQPLLRLTGTGQGWALFANPDIYPSRLEIRIRRAGKPNFEPLYLRLDPERDWADDLLSYRRVRGIYDAGGNGNRPRAPYRRFADWIGHRVLSADPTVEEVEIRMQRTHTTLRGQAHDDHVDLRHAITVRRDP